MGKVDQTLFLLRQSKEILIVQVYVDDIVFGGSSNIVWKFKMEDSKSVATPISTTTVLNSDKESEHVDQKEYRSMIRSLLYLTATRPDIQFLVCLCTRFQVSPRTSH
jgi:hypothetical protein